MRRSVFAPPAKDRESAKRWLGKGWGRRTGYKEEPGQLRAAVVAVIQFALYVLARETFILRSACWPGGDAATPGASVRPDNFTRAVLAPVLLPPRLREHDPDGPPPQPDHERRTLWFTHYFSGFSSFLSTLFVSRKILRHLLIRIHSQLDGARLRLGPTSLAAARAAPFDRAPDNSDPITVALELSQSPKA